MTKVAKNVMQEFINSSSPPNQNLEKAEPHRIEMSSLQDEIGVPFEGSRDWAYLKEFMRYKPPEFDAND